jgi:hypothetical protein
MPGQAPVAHTCNLSYSRESQFKASQAHSLQDPISKHLSQKRAGGVAQGTGPEFKPQYQKKKERIPEPTCYATFLPSVPA